MEILACPYRSGEQAESLSDAQRDERVYGHGVRIVTAAWFR